MNEIELKILEIKVEEVRKKLKALGAEKKEKVEIHALHFDYPNLQLKEKKELLRLRRVGERTELCFKGKSKEGHFRVSEEIEVQTDSFEKTIDILKRVGLIIRSESKKTRESYTFGKMHFEIDTFPKVPSFLEIECPSKEEIENWVQRLGYTLDQTTNMTGGEVLEYYKKK